MMPTHGMPRQVNARNRACRNSIVRTRHLQQSLAQLHATHHAHRVALHHIPMLISCPRTGDAVWRSESNRDSPKTLTTSSNPPAIDSHGIPPALPSSADPELHLRSRSRLLSRLSSLAEVPPEGWVRFPQSCGEGPPPPKAQKIQWSPAVVTKGKLESGGLERVESQCDLPASV